MEFLAEYGLFFAKTLTLLVGALLGLAGVLAILSRGKPKAEGQINVTALHEKYRELALELKQKMLPKQTYKHESKAFKQNIKVQEKLKAEQKVPARLFVLRFKGDIRASAVDALREEVTAIIGVAAADDEVLVCVDSGGGVVNSYGLAASQLERLRSHDIRLTVAVDKIAASGGYLMAAVANSIIAAPFAIIGSIGVVANMPNFNRFLKKHNIDFEQFTAGEYKRTVTLFGENTKKDRQKFQEDLDETHDIFKQAVQKYRPQMNMDEVAHGEHWLASRAFELSLVDKLQTSDDYILAACEEKDVYELSYQVRKKVSERIATGMNTLVQYWYE